MFRVRAFLVALWRDERGGDGLFRAGIALAGGALGFTLLGPFGASVGFLAGQVVGNILFPQELPDIDGPRLDGTRTMTSAYGDPVRFGYGQFVCGTSLTYYPGFEEHEIVEESGGKGGPTQTARSYTYTGSFGCEVCEGPADAVLKIWANRQLIYNSTNTTDPLVDAQRINSAPGANAIRIYLGTETQLPDPTEQADVGINAAPAYRGLVRIFFQNYPLDDTGGIPPQITVHVAMKATEVLPSTTLEGITPNTSFWEWLPDKSAFFISSMLRVNNIDQSVVAADSSIIGQPAFPCVNSEGNFYRTHDEFAGSTNRVDKFDGVTLQFLFTSTEFIDPFTDVPIGNSGGLSWEVGRVFGGIALPAGGLAGELLFLRRQARELILVLDLDPLNFGTVINKYETAVEVIDSVVVDSERHLWTAYNSVGGDIVLDRLSPGSGSIVETHTLVGETIDHMAYDPGTNSLILGDSSNGLIRFGIDSQVIDGRLDGVTYVSSGSKNRSEFWNGPSWEGKLYLQTGATLGDFAEFDVRNMVKGRTWNPGTDFGLSSNLEHRGIFDESRMAMIKRHDGTHIHWLYLFRKTGDSITVKSIVDDISTRVGLIAADIDTSGLTDTLHGYLVDRRMAARNALEPLRKLFFFNPVEEDWKVKFPLLFGSSVATIPEIDLAAGGEDIRTDVPRLEEDLVPEVEVPELLELTYANAENDGVGQGEYLPVVQVAKRPRTTTNSRRRRLLSFPGTFSSNQDAARRLETLLYNLVAKRRPLSFKTSQRWLALSPADVVTVQEGGDSQVVSLGEVVVGADNVIEFRGAAEDPTIQTSVATGEDGGVPAQIIDSTAPSEHYVMDIPLLRDGDDGFGVYAASGPYGDSAWPGAQIMRSADGSVYSPFVFVSKSRAMEHGFAVSALADGDEDVWDRDSTLQITMLRGTLPSSTEAAVLDGANVLLIGKEIVCYVTAVDDGDGKFTVSTLLRGRGGTEGETGLHVTGERVIVLDSTTLMRKAMDLSDQSVTFFYKAITRGGRLLEAVRKQVTVLGKSQWPRASTNVSGTITANDWTIKWGWRATVNGAWKNSIGVPPGIAFDFEVDVLSGLGGAVLRKYDSTITANGSVVTDSTTPQFFYDDADQVADFGSVQTTLTVKIYQLDPSVGRGFPREVTLVGG